MYTRLDLLLVFMGGFALGGGLSAVWFNSKTKIYKRIVETRLDAISASVSCPVVRELPDVLRKLQDATK